jgi:ABC-type antimicrobial peptide transport system permease subunit
VGASALLLVGAAVFLRGAHSAATADHGVRTSDTLVVPVADDRTQQALVQEISRHPSVAALAVSAPRFGSGSLVTTATALDRGTSRPERSAPAACQFVSRDYFDVLGIQLLRGRAFTAAERAMDAGVVVVSERIAQRLFDDADPVGRAIRFRVSPVSPGAAADPAAADRTYTIVGVVRDLKSRMGLGSVSSADLYIPIAPESPATSIVVRVSGDAEQARRALLERLLAVDPSLGDIVTLQTMFGVQEYMLRVAFWTTAITGGLALVLTVSGLFGVLSYVVARRTNEIGVRMALGASSAQVARLVLSQSLLPVGIGLAIGAALTGGLVKTLMGWFQSLNVTDTVRVYDPVAYAGSVIVIVGACVLAAWLPARRAARIDPHTILKQE